MEKKLILSVICTVLLSFGAMAKSNVKTIKSKTLHTKLVQHRQSKQSAKDFSCVRFRTSCGPSGWACGDTFVDIINHVLEAERAACG
jgi:hypothetical protein